MSLPADTATRLSNSRPGTSTSSLPSPVAPGGIADEPLAAAYEKRLHTLQDTLKERDQVVQMLTQRLEQAADQLDRMQRSGGGRGGAIATGVPPELIENQQTMSKQMTQLLGQWEELQAPEMLGRIESRLNELHDLVSSGAASSINVSLAKAHEVSGHLSKSSTSASVSSGVPAEPAKSGWEAIKAAMLAGENIDTANLDFSAPRLAPASEVVSVAPVAIERSAPPPLPEPPPAIDFDIANQQQLCDAIRDRDEFIAVLLRRLSSPDSNTEFPDWEKLNLVPENLHRELLGLRDRLQDKLRVAEVDLSIQRAKLAREEGRLAVKTEQLARQMRQLGLTPDEPSTTVSSSRPVSESSNTTQGRRWLQFLQRSAGGNGSGSEGK